MKIKLKEITLENFKGTQKFHANFSQNTKVSGENHTGKTTLADAFFWCLFGKNSQGQTKFDIKTRDENGLIIPQLLHTVSVTLEIDGVDHSFSRTLREKWEVKNGETEARNTGDTTDYMWNDATQSEKEYKERISSIISEDKFRMLTDVICFPTMAKDAQRKILRDMSGADNLLSLGLLDDSIYDNLIAAIQKGMTIEEYEKSLNTKKKAINEKKDSLVAKMEEVQNQIAALPDTDDIDKQLAELNAQRAAVQDEYNAVDLKLNDTASRIKAFNVDKDNVRLEIDEVSQQISSLVQNASLDGTKRFNEQNTLYLQYCQQVSQRKLRTQTINNQIEAANVKLKELSETRNALLTELHSIEDSVWQGKTTCETCGQSLPDEIIEDAMNTFAENKKKKLEANKTKGLAVKAERESLTETVNKLTNELTELNATTIEPVAQPTPAAAPDLSGNKDYLTLIQKKSELENKLNSMVYTDSTAAFRTQRDAIAFRKNEIGKQIEELMLKKGEANSINRLQDRLSELKKEHKAAAKEQSTLEQEYEAVHLYKEKDVELLQKVNNMFTMTTFRFFEDMQKNGGYKETCECTLNGKPYATLSNSEKINVGLDIVNTLQTYFNVFAPIIIDNAEAVTEFIHTDSQTIKLYVSNDRTLKIENELF